MTLKYVPKKDKIVHMKDFKPDIPYNDLPLLPPDTNKIETIKILKQENSARSAIAELKGIANIIPNQSILINAIILQEAKDSSEIENIITTQDELYKAISGNQKKYDSATKEVIYYREALYSGFNNIVKKGFLTVNDIISIQEELLKNDAGIRKTPGTSLVNDKTGEIVYTPPQNEDVINKLLSNTVKYLNDDDNSLAKMAIIHYQFESIHPFYDGNGRTGRIINILYLILKNYLDIPILYLSSYIIKNKAEYYRLLRSVTSDENWEEWIIYILKGIEVVAKETISKVLTIKELLDKTIEKVKVELPKIYSKELIEELFVHPYSKIDFLTKVLGVERKAASRYLSQLQDIGVLKEYKIGREKIYINVELLEMLKSSI
jgi:Fic family protein